MKRIFAVALLLMSFAAVALADGSFLPPPVNAGAVLLADGSGLPPTGSATKPLQGAIAA